MNGSRATVPEKVKGLNRCLGVAKEHITYIMRRVTNRRQFKKLSRHTRL